MNRCVNECVKQLMAHAGRHATKYLEEFFRLRCAPDVLIWKLFPNTKEITETFSAYAAARRFLIADYARDDPSVVLVAVGDGSTPRTAAMFALMTKWTCISVDPNLNPAKDWTAIKRLEVQPVKVEESSLAVEGRKVLIAAVHSHAGLPESVAACAGAERVAVVAIPCCVKLELPAPPDHEYEDEHNLSPERTVRIWRRAA